MDDEHQDRTRGRVPLRRQKGTLARRHAADAPIAARRNWPFPLYPGESIDELARAVRAHPSAPGVSVRLASVVATEGISTPPLVVSPTRVARS